jgi:hypothetical protein
MQAIITKMLKIHVVCLLLCFTAISAHAQQSSDTVINKNLSLVQMSVQPVFTLPFTVPANLSTQHLPFFCDKEYKLEKVTKIPFRFRIGSVEYCDKMEGKH